jgi:hypothetical protein
MPLILSGSVDISGSMTATTILVSSPGAAGMVSSSAQITELVPLMAYTASIKAASIVSSSQQVQNYFTFARTGSVNTFFGNQGISGSLNVTSATGTNVAPQLTVNNTTTNGYGIVRLVGAGRGGLIDFYNTSSAQASIAANDGALQFYANGDSTGTPKQTINATGVGVGTTSPSGVLDVIGTNVFLGATSKIVLSYDLGTSSNSNSPELAFYGQSFSAASSVYGPSIQAVNQTTFARKDLVFYQHNAADFTDRYEAMRLTYGGILQIVNGVEINNANSLKLFTESNGAYWSLRTYNSVSNQLRFNYQGSDLASIATSTGNYTALSDVNKKKDFELSQIGLNEVLGLRPTLYRMKTEDDTQDKHLGFIAQEVKEFIPQAYSETGEGDDKFIGLNEMPIIAVLTKAIQEQQAIIDGLIAIIEALENN